MFVTYMKWPWDNRRTIANHETVLGITAGCVYESEDDGDKNQKEKMWTEERRKTAKGGKTKEKEGKKMGEIK